MHIEVPRSGMHSPSPLNINFYIFCEVQTWNRDDVTLLSSYLCVIQKPEKVFKKLAESVWQHDQLILFAEVYSQSTF